MFNEGVPLEPEAREMLNQLIDSAIGLIPKNLKVTRDAKDGLQFQHDAEFFFGMVWGSILVGFQGYMSQFFGRQPTDEEFKELVDTFTARAEQVKTVIENL